MTKNNFIPYSMPYKTIGQIEEASLAFYLYMNQRRSIRDFASTPIPDSIIEHILMTASSAPSGANKQPWTFCAISNPTIKSQIRQAAEKEEHENYHGRMNDEWLKDLAVLGTDENKHFLETAPWLIAVFKKPYDQIEEHKSKNYYVTESVGIACGFLLTAIYQSGLVALTHTPSPMNFLKKILKRPDNETPFLLIPVGYPAADVTVPDVKRKGKEEVIEWYK